MPESSLTGDYLRQLFERSHFAILVANNDATYVDVNEAACRLLGAPREAIIGHTLMDFIKPMDARVVKAQWQAFLRDGQQEGIFELRRLDGVYQRASFHAEANFVPGFHCSFLLPVDAPTIGTNPTISLCAWTKRVWEDGEWISLERFLHRALGKSVSHGMSPQAYQQFFDASSRDGQNSP